MASPDSSQIVAWGDGLSSLNLGTQKLLNVQQSHFGSILKTIIRVRASTRKGQNLIYCLTDRSEVQVLNISLYQKIKLEKREIDPPAGIIFTLSLQAYGRVLDFFLIESSASEKQVSKVEEIKLQEGLKPTGLLVAIHDDGVTLINFDRA